MLTLPLLSVCALLCVVDESSPLFREPIDREFIATYDGSHQRYVQLIPESFRGNTELDVVIALHGHGSDRWQFIREARPECSEMRQVAAEHGMLFVSPDYRATTSWMGPAAESDLLDLMDQLHREFRIRRVFIAGGSMGGTSALAFAALHPGHVDGVIALNGTANLLEYDRFSDAIAASFGGTREQVPEVYRSRSAELFPDRFQMPVAATTGGMDTIVPPESVIRLVSELKTRNMPVLLIHRDNGGHETNREDTRAACEYVVNHSSFAVRNVDTPRFGSNQTVVCLGDSVTGIYYHTGGRRAWPELLQSALSLAAPDTTWSVINAGISGQTTSDGLQRLDTDVLKHSPDSVAISFGLNDVTRVSPEVFRSNLNDMIRRCRNAQATVILCTPNAVIDTADRPQTRLEEYCQIIRELAQQHQTLFVDQFAIGGQLRTRAPRTWRLTLSDAIHPNLHGHQRMAEQVCKTMTGRGISLDAGPPLFPVLPIVRRRQEAGQPVQLLIASTLASPFQKATQSLEVDSRFQTEVWPVDQLSLADLEADAQKRVRTKKPDLVLLTFPADFGDITEEQRIHRISWVMNWSLSFGNAEWDCVVVHPDVLQPMANRADADLIRHLVRAQDLPMIDRPTDAMSSTEELIELWLIENLPPQ